MNERRSTRLSLFCLLSCVPHPSRKRALGRDKSMRGGLVQPLARVTHRRRPAGKRRGC
ncbi:hypothetical protein MBELCI_2110 [Limimaricola cinnabarinus LL-001]|uniref:Uncharacterized protein n=1 Tax=Limimaricola cinnabarinus LL-001 TaxID=1337093 RepID=U3AMU1_9RHOB|nr:hypothetical protein MBELCI_2110 [Limimaricola cinnabarinus LL-001]